MEAKKIVRFDKRADKEIKKFPSLVIADITAAIEILSNEGKLEKPTGKKIDKDLYEIRVKYKGQWRAIYAYIDSDLIIILSGFQKKTQKTPISELEKARRRMKEHL